MRGDLLHSLLECLHQERLFGDHSAARNDARGVGSSSDENADKVGESRTTLADHVLSELRAHACGAKHRGSITAPDDGATCGVEQPSEHSRIFGADALHQASHKGIISPSAIQLAPNRSRGFSHQSRRTAFVTKYPAPAARSEHTSVRCSGDRNRACTGHDANALYETSCWNHEFGIGYDHDQGGDLGNQMGLDSEALVIRVTTMGADGQRLRGSSLAGTPNNFRQ